MKWNNIIQLRFILLLMSTGMTLTYSSCDEEGGMVTAKKNSSIELFIVDKKGEPLEGVRIGASATAAGQWFYFGESTADAEGRVFFEKMGASDYAFYHISEGIGVVSDTLITTIEADKVHSMTFPLKLEKETSIKGDVVLTVTNSEGSAMVGLSLTLYKLNNQIEEVVGQFKTDYVGKVKIFGLDSGSYKVDTGIGDIYLLASASAGIVNSWEMEVDFSPKPLSKEAWSVVYVSSEVGAFVGANLLDNDPMTVWNSSWSITPRPTHPHIIDVDMGEERSISGLSLLNGPSSWGGYNWKNFEIFISNDGSTWTTQGIYILQEHKAEQLFSFTNTQTCRYFRVSSIDQWHPNTNLTMCLAELGAWDY